MFAARRVAGDDKGEIDPDHLWRPDRPRPDDVDEPSPAVGVTVHEALIDQTIVAGRGRCHGVDLIRRQGQRLLDEDVLAGVEGVHGPLGV